VKSDLLLNQEDDSDLILHVLRPWDDDEYVAIEKRQRADKRLQDRLIDAQECMLLLHDGNDSRRALDEYKRGLLCEWRTKMIMYAYALEHVAKAGNECNLQSPERIVISWDDGVSATFSTHGGVTTWAWSERAMLRPDFELQSLSKPTPFSPATCAVRGDDHIVYERTGDTFAEFELSRLRTRYRTGMFSPATRIDIEGDDILVYRRVGDRIRAPLSACGLLRDATLAQRESYRITGDGRSIHWPELGEDISVIGLLLDFGLDRNARGYTWVRPNAL
jgi:hypothetical protein